ncbi:hypothetical protein F511_31948 [Dorcoceras hygrometricum]|uniref:DUF547 domain-containing protein n=1 Tax=Dorcoceras hygrometricum TaxID=472368 RepID=A0A2Z7D0X1_9LAMI|nr:hypothetical protein F511_31948 [Dorcoceras hygrometricum]
MGNLKNVEPKKRQLSPGETQNILIEEILQLQKQLESQTAVRSALEKAMNCQPLLDDPAYKSLSQPAENLIKEITLLEMEVVYLEKYLLAMYRRNFAKRASSLPTVDEQQKTDSRTDCSVVLEVPRTKMGSVTEDSFIRCSKTAKNDDPGGELHCKYDDILGAEILVDSGIDRSHSSLSQYSASSFRTSSPFEAVAQVVESYHSLPLWMLERAQDSNSNASFAEFLGSRFPNRVRESPNWISEEMIKCISTIYCHLSDPPLFNHGSNSSPQGQHDLSSLSCDENSSSNSWMNNPFNGETSKDFSGSLRSIIEVQGLVPEPQRLNVVEVLLQKFRSLISRLATVDPGKLKHEEKLAFWINVHNAIVMHAFLVHGIPRGNQKRISLALKAAYNIGGHIISVVTIQSSILGCRLPRPSQWLHSWLFPKTKLKSGEPGKSFAIKHPEPRLRFALCSGCQSDPLIRLYTPKKIFQELEIAKEEYIQMNIRKHKDQRLHIPKNVEYFVKEMGLSPSGVAEMLELSMPESLKKNFQQGKYCKKIDWIPHDFAFRFLISNELVK